MSMGPPKLPRSRLVVGVAALAVLGLAGCSQPQQSGTVPTADAGAPPLALPLTTGTAVAARPAPDDMVEITVSDTGAGLSPEVVEKLFQPFVTTKQQGMGVGLSISRTIIEAHGGRIWVESGAEGGAIFHFTLRAAPDEGAAEGG